MARTKTLSHSEYLQAVRLANLAKARNAKLAKVRGEIPASPVKVSKRAAKNASALREVLSGTRFKTHEVRRGAPYFANAVKKSPKAYYEQRARNHRSAANNDSLFADERKAHATIASGYSALAKHANPKPR